MEIPQIDRYMDIIEYIFQIYNKKRFRLVYVSGESVLYQENDWNVS